MKKIMVFGKPAGGKSTFSKKLAQATGITLHHLDLIEYKRSGERVPKDEYITAHNQLLETHSWIIEGLGPMQSFWSRIDAADTLIFLDLPYRVHYWWAVKRFMLSPFRKIAGWPDGSSTLKGTLLSFKYLRMSSQFWTAELFAKIKERAHNKNIYRITSASELDSFLQTAEKQM